MPRLGRCRLDLSLARASGARLRRLGGPRPPRGARGRCRRRRGALRHGVRSRDRPRRAGRDRGGDARAPLRGDRAARPAGHGSHGLGPGRDGALPARLERLDPRDQGAPRRRRRASAARRHPRGDGRVLRRARPRGAHRRDQPRDRPRADQGRDPAAAPAAASRSRREPARARRGAAAAARALEASLVDLLASRAGTKAADLGGGVRAVREYGTLRLEGTVEWGPWTLEAERDDLEVRARRPGDHLAGRRKKVQDLLVDAKVPRAERDDWPVVVCAARSSPCRGSRTRPDGKAPSPRGGWRGERDRRGVGEILIEETGRQGARAAPSVPRSRPTTPAATCCSWASSRAPCSSWPT